MYQQKDTTHFLYSQERSSEDSTPIDYPVYPGDDAG